MVKLKLSDAIAALAAIKALPKNLPPKISYHFGRIGVALKREADTYSEQRNEKLRELGTESEDGSKVTLDHAAQAQFNKWNEDILQSEIEIPFDQKTQEEILGDRDPEISPDVWIGIDPFVKVAT